jgi:AraC-like DNA-binding protein
MVLHKPYGSNSLLSSPDGGLTINALTDMINRRIKRREPVSVQQLCELYGWSQPTLYRKVTNLLGISPKQLITRLQCTHARKLLKTTDLSVVDIAYQCGFSSGNYFAKVFKHHYHSSPSGFRKEQ